MFSTYAVVVAISKQEGDVAAGILECINKMGKPRQTKYTDDEGALANDAMNTYVKDQYIEHIVTRTHAMFAERFIRTFKLALYRRTDNYENANDIQWTD